MDIDYYLWISSSVFFILSLLHCLVLSIDNWNWIYLSSSKTLRFHTLINLHLNEFISFHLFFSYLPTQLHLMESIKTWTCVKLKWRLQLWWLGNLDYCSILLSKIAEKHCLELKLVNLKSTNKQHFEANQGRKLPSSSNVYIQRLELSYHSFFCIPFFAHH